MKRGAARYPLFRVRAWGVGLVVATLLPGCSWLSSAGEVISRPFRSDTPAPVTVANPASAPSYTATLAAPTQTPQTPRDATTATPTRAVPTATASHVAATPTAAATATTARRSPSPTAAAPTATATAVSAVPAAEVGSVAVKVSVIGPDRQQVSARDAVVWIPGSTAPPNQANRSKVGSRDKRFDPHVTVVATGGTVEFPNYDPINHNVFSISEAANFDLGLYRNGDSRQQTFERSGVIPIFCNIHPQMVAYVVVVDGGVFAQTGADGSARLDNLPPGKHKVRVWQEKSREWSGEVVVTPGTVASLSVVLDASSWRDVAHKRKDGSDYPPPDSDENRY